jgi:predicted nucleic acid-binding protein
MNDNCFIDTNILVYCYTGDEPEKQRKALDIANRPDSFISTQVLTELSNTLKRKFNLNWKEIETLLSEVNSGY